MKKSLRVCRARFCVVALLSFGSVLSQKASAISYTITDLGQFDSYSVATSINDSGQVAGYFLSDPSGLVSHAFLYDGGIRHDLGTFGGSSAAALGINDSGRVVGWANNTSGQRRAFVYANGSLQNVGPAYVDGNSEARGIAGNGGIVGVAGSDAFLQSGGVVTNIGTWQSTSIQPNAINDAGQVVGLSMFCPFLYQGGNISCVAPQRGEALDINNFGQIAGWITTPGGDEHAFLYGPGGVLDIGPSGVNSIAYGINNKGQVVGWAGASNQQRAFLYDSGAMQDLNNLIAPGSGWTLTEARAINEAGQIAGIGVTGLVTVLPSGALSVDAVSHAFLLTPVPVPAAFWLFSSGFIGLLGFMSRRPKIK